MRALNRARLLWGYLRGKAKLNALPVEYIVETTAKCNLYCPMCPRETHKQPKEDMAGRDLQRGSSRSIGRSAEHMMLIGLGEPLLDPQDLRANRILRRTQHLDTALDQRYASRRSRRPKDCSATPLEHITLSFDGSTKESFEYYRKGARFEKVRDNFVRFARMKQERGAKCRLSFRWCGWRGTGTKSTTSCGSGAPCPA